MKKFIVSTTINPPTEAIKKFDYMKDWQLVVAGDLKTPQNYSLDNGIYLTPDMQESYDKDLSEAIGWNCIQRRNFAMLWAKDMGADIIALVDDDNIPYNDWGKNLTIGKETEVFFYQTDLPAFDPVGVTNYPQLWHRGYPLQLLAKRDYKNVTKKIIIPDVQADFWNGDPDIDAICRMEHAPECKFDKKYFPMASNRIAPFNSQNTIINAKLLKNYFLSPDIGRMDDIWAAYYLQAKTNANVVFCKPSVYQARNPHNLIVDMKKEYLGYEYNLDIVTSIVKNAENINNYLPERAKKAWDLYKKHF